MRNMRRVNDMQNLMLMLYASWFRPYQRFLHLYPASTRRKAVLIRLY